MKKITLILLLFTSIGINAQNTVTQEDVDKQINVLKVNINSIKGENTKLKTEINNLKSKLTTLNAKFEALTENVAGNTVEIGRTNTDLNGKISNSETTTNQKFTQVDSSLSKNSLWSIIGVLGAIIVSALLYWLLSKRQKSDLTDVIDQLSKTKSSIEESLVSEFGKQTELMETQIKLMEEQKNNFPIAQIETEIDHSLALKVADEITLIERNISLMDQNVKGLKHLARSVSKLKDNLLANGYELPVLLGKNYNQGMKVIISSSISDENLEEGVEVITKVLKPQVNYKDIMIQTAQIEVSVG